MTEQRHHCARLVSLAVHELRTPAAVVSGYLRMVLRHFGDNLTDQQKKLLEESEKSCGTLSRLLADFADLSQLEDGAVRFQHQDVSLWTLLREVASSVQEGKDRGLILEVETPAEDVVIDGDRGRLSEAVASLMTAVLRERQSGARVVAAGRVGELDGSRSAVVAFGDLETVPTLSAAFGPASPQQFDEYRGGLGFRLPAAARIVEAHGGRLASPVSERGRLVILMALPISIARAESIA
jgi:two-component system sensor histidine kinase BaeS